MRFERRSTGWNRRVTPTEIGAKSLAAATLRDARLWRAPSVSARRSSGDEVFFLGDILEPLGEEPALAGVSNHAAELVRSNRADQSCSSEREILSWNDPLIFMRSSVAIFAAHHMMIVMLLSPTSPEFRHGHRFRFRRHPFRRPHAAWPVHWRIIPVQRPQTRFPRDRRGAG